MGFVVTAYDLDQNDIAEALHALAHDLDEGCAFVTEASDSIEADADTGTVAVGMDLEVAVTDESRVGHLIDLDAARE